MLYRRPAAALLTAVAFALVLAADLSAQDSEQARRDEAARLVAVLTSDASLFDKAKACQRLALIGDKQAVPALAALLADQRLSNYARYALEPIADPAADQALRQAIERLDGDLLVGVLNSIGQRRDGQAVARLEQLLADPDDAVAEAAARALGQIGNAQTAEILQRQTQAAAPQRRPVLAGACLLCAQRLLRDGDRQRAAELFDFVRQADVPEHLALAATYDTILARGADGIPLLVEQLDSQDESRFRLALQAARQVEGKVASNLVATLNTVSPARQALLLVALRDLGDPASVPAIVEAARTGATEVRVQAIAALAPLADATVVPLLIDAAVDADDRVSQAARSTLASLQGDKVDAAIVAMLGSRQVDKRLLAIGVAAQRRIAAATPALFELADNTDATIRLAAIQALGATIQLEELPKLLARATVAGVSAAELDAARQAARAACARMPQGQCAMLLSGMLPADQTEATAFLLETLGLVGGPLALETVVTAAESDEDATQDAATRVLGEWLSGSAAPAMFELAKSLSSEKYRIRVLRGYIRLARQLDMPLEERLQVCRNALTIAERDDEKTLVLDVLGRYPAPAGLAIAASLLDQASLKEEACGTIVAVAGRLVQSAPAEVEQALELVLQTTSRQNVANQAKALLAEAREARGAK